MLNPTLNQQHRQDIYTRLKSGYLKLVFKRIKLFLISFLIKSARLTSLKLQQEIDMIRRQVEHAKLRLTTDIKVFRNKASP